MHRNLALALLLVGCQAGAPLGTTCASSAACASPLVCRLGRCRNECVGNRDCPLGAQCFLDATGLGACQLDVDRSCGAESCGAGLTCLGSTCVRACGGATDCPSDGTCTLASGASIGVCSDPRTGGDGGVPPDASGAIDAGTDATGDAGSGCAPLHATQVCTGVDFACALRTDHSVVCWGNGQSGTLGVPEPSTLCTTTQGSYNCASTPVVVPLEGGAAFVDAQELACGDTFACARVGGGGVRCWGRNFLAMLGNVGDGVPGAREVVMSGVPISGATHIGAGGAHACALVGATSVLCWGANDESDLGRGTTTTSEQPGIASALGTVGSIRDMIALSAGTCVIHDTGTVNELYCLGSNTSAELGVAPGAPSTALVHLDHVVLSHTAPVVIAGLQMGCALDASGHAQCWGLNNYGSLGRVEHAFYIDPLPALLYGAGGTLVFTQLFGGGSSETLCGAAGADLWCWGANADGSAGVDPSVGDAVYATRVVGIDHPQAGACSQTECCAIDGAGIVSCWGNNAAGQLGRGTATLREWMPAPVCAH